MTDFLEQLAVQLRDAAKKPNVLSYKPNSPTHKDFHGSRKVGRILRGGNRSGKSVAGAVESIWRSVGRHPHQGTHEIPIRGRIVTVDIEAGINQIILPLLKQWVPQSELVDNSFEASWSTRKKLFTFRNGSTIEVKTHQQEVESFAGVPLHWVWFDEECPKAIFDECRLRLIDFNGCWWMTMTPVAGQDWIFDRYIATSAKNVDMFEVDIADNPHLNQEALKLLEDDLDEDEAKVRRQGFFVPKGGLVLKEFDYHRHVIEGGKPVPKNWSVYVSIDHGYNAPTAILWHAVSPGGKVVTFHEHYQNKWVIKQHVDEIFRVNQELGVFPILYMGDPSMSQTSAITGTSPLQTYRELGIPLMQAKKDVAGGIDKMNEYFKYDMWTITDDCPNTIREFRGYSFKIYNSPKISDRNNPREEPNKKKDHTPDSARYFFSFMPRLQPEKKRELPKASKTETHMEDFPWQIDRELTPAYMRQDITGYGFGEV
jgi:PBSX family phage terminase large subunit